MKNFLRIAFFFTVLLAPYNFASALEILFPQKNPYSTNSKITYIMGNVAKGASLTINGKPAKVWHNGAFCQTINLSAGNNIFILKETISKISSEKTIKITQPIPKTSSTAPAPPKTTDFKDLQYAIVLTDGAPVRSKASASGERITHLPANTMLMLEKKFDSWYKINVGKTSEQLWIYEKNVKILYPVNNRIKVSVREAKTYEDGNFSYLKLKLDLPVAYKIKEQNNDIELTLYGIKDIQALCDELDRQIVFEKILLTKNSEDNITISFPSKEIIWGYDADYDGNTLIFKKRKKPKIYYSHPLQGITIAVDAGHGGKEAGTIGPTKIPEKEVNLAISKLLQKELIKRGANVVMTRDNDDFTELYERPEIANRNNALICLSIHSNSMVDGDPFKKHGTSTFYYNKHAKNLADTIKNKMVTDLKLRDDGTNYASFVLTRPTMPISVLIEVAYMPNPDEYLKLTNHHFQYKTARSIADSLEIYLKNTIDNSTNEKN